MSSSINRLSRAFLLAFVFVALVLGYWGLLRQNELLVRQDNPRLLLEEQQIRRGQIVDRNGVVLAETQLEPTSGLGTRHYPNPTVAAVVGYYSLRHGVGGVEASYDDVLRGDAFLTPGQNLINRLLHRPQRGGDVRLSIDLTIQQIVDRELEGRTGAIILLEAPHGDVLAIGSRPSFDPNRLDEQWDSLKSDADAPLLNRATQSLFQPGTILQSIILGTAVNVGTVTPTDQWRGDLAVVRLDGSSLPCAQQPPIQINTLQDAFLWGCPHPFQLLGTQLGAHMLNVALSDFGLLEAPVFELPTAAPSFDSGTSQDPALTAIGQSDLTVSALQMGLVAAAFADHGQMPAPRLVQAIRPPGSEWETTSLLGNPRGTISRASADTLAELMATSVRLGAAQAARQAAHTIYGQVGLALSGPQSSLSSWFVGFVYLDNGDAISVAVLLENSDDTTGAARIGGTVLAAAADSLD
jgi:peptidoglycan glycosyltransferase